MNSYFTLVNTYFTKCNDCHLKTVKQYHLVYYNSISKKKHIIKSLYNYKINIYIKSTLMFLSNQFTT